MAHTTTFRLTLHTSLLGLVFTISTLISAQTKIDSMVIKYLVKNGQISQDDVVLNKITKTGKKTDKVSSNIYKFEVFCLENSNDVLRIYGFGTYSEHSDRCMLVEYVNAYSQKYTYLSLGSIDQELIVLSSIFTFGKHKLADQYQREILEIYLGYRQGRIQVPTFLH